MCQEGDPVEKLKNSIMLQAGYGFFLHAKVPFLSHIAKESSCLDFALLCQLPWEGLLRIEMMKTKLEVG